MKYLLLFVWSIALVLSHANAQKPFEGIIVYKLHNSAEEKQDAELTALFGKNSIRLRFKENENYDKEEVLINLDSGKVFTLNSTEKTYRVKKLVSTDFSAADLSSKKIAGYETTAVDMSHQSIAGSLFGGGKLVLYKANDLYFPVPEKYSTNPELVIVSQNKIVLGAVLKYNKKTLMYDENEDDDTLQDMPIITVDAISVKLMNLPTEDFIIPSDYAKYSYNDFSVADSAIAMVDSTAWMMDSVATALPPPPPPPAKAPAKPKSKPVKSSTKTNAARKPD
jgi:hypothetical protein